MTRSAIYQPMSTAPRDGTIVDLWLSGGGRYADAWWEEEDQTWCGLDEGMFTHWAPVPVHAIEVPTISKRGLALLATVFCSLFAGAVLIFWLSLEIGK